MLKMLYNVETQASFHLSFQYSLTTNKYSCLILCCGIYSGIACSDKALKTRVIQLLVIVGLML